MTHKITRVDENLYANRARYNYLCTILPESNQFIYRMYLSTCTYMNSKVNLINTNLKCCNTGYPCQRCISVMLPFLWPSLLAIHRAENMIKWHCILFISDIKHLCFFVLCVCMYVGV